MGRYHPGRLLIFLLAGALLLSVSAGCGSSSATTKPTATPSPTASPTPMPLPQGNLAKVQIGLTPFATGLNRPDFVTYANDGSGRIYITEQPGRIVVADASGHVYPQPFLDVQTQWFAELGLMSLAFHPNFKTNGLFFISYSDLEGDTIIARYKIANGNPLRADPQSAQVILHIEEPDTQEHRSGMLVFGHDGYLYIGVGDGGRGAPSANGQRKDTILGKILRIDIDHTSSGKAYAIPPTNPFAHDANAAPEIWAYGVRNPWRFSFDRATNNLFIGDVGESAHEEVDFQPANSKGGVNFGWNVYEGSSCLRDDDCALANYSGPIAVYPHTNGRCAVIGGYVYQGKTYPALQGIYLFGDLCSGRIYGLTAADAALGKPVTYRQLIDSSLYLSSFGEDQAGNVYAVDLHAGIVYRITAQ